MGVTVMGVTEELPTTFITRIRRCVRLHRVASQFISKVSGQYDFLDGRVVAAGDDFKYWVKRSVNLSHFVLLRGNFSLETLSYSLQCRLLVVDKAEIVIHYGIIDEFGLLSCFRNRWVTQCFKKYVDIAFS